MRYRQAGLALGILDGLAQEPRTSSAVVVTNVLGSGADGESPDTGRSILQRR